MSTKSWFELTVRERGVVRERMVAAFPVGARVRVIASDDETAAYIGAVGRVRGYDFGDADTLPLVSVGFDGAHDKYDGDGFRSNDLERI